MKQTTVYLGLGGNIGDSLSLLNQAKEELIKVQGITQFKISPFYSTSPVGNPCLDFFINAVCCFQTTLDPQSLLRETQSIETFLGKVPKPKDAPRPIDLDILFYGSACYRDAELEIPHPKWQERLFVLVPLADLIPEIEIFSDHGPQRFILKELIQVLQTSSHQIVSLVEKNYPLH